MNQNIWNRLRCLESRDVVQKWFNEIHARELNARRANEINSAAKQGREFFNNAAQSDHSVRPLLSFYGVSCLTKALTLLMSRSGGEESLTGAHGLETANWGSIMSGDTSDGISKMADLKIRTTKGLFQDFLSATNNLICIHVRSGGVDWRLNYDVPEPGNELTVLDLLSRNPDLQQNLAEVSSTINFATMNECTFTTKKGFTATVRMEHFKQFSECYESSGYTMAESGIWAKLNCDTETFSKNKPQIVHTQINKMFGSIPGLHIARPFANGARYSQLAIVFMLAYVLGMLVRYYPTHWVSLVQGARGDGLWPTLNNAQQLIESSYPELVIELIDDTIKQTQERGA